MEWNGTKLSIATTRRLSELPGNVFAEHFLSVPLRFPCGFPRNFSPKRQRNQPFVHNGERFSTICGKLARVARHDSTGAEAQSRTKFVSTTAVAYTRFGRALSRTIEDSKHFHEHRFGLDTLRRN